MPLPKPSLDNRTFDQLTSEGRALIPRLAPLWTDHNASDPGITLLELGAWLAEQNIYRFDRLTDEATRAFARLVGIEPAMAGVAHTVISVQNSNAAAVALPARMQVATPTTPLFETTHALFASPATLTRVLSGKDTLTDVTASNQTLGGYAAFGPRPRTGHALYLGFDRALDAPGAVLSLYVWTRDWQQDATTRAALIAEFDGLTATHRSHCDPPLDWRRHYRASTLWEFYAGAAGWLPLQGVVDETRALTLTGFVHFTAPVNHQAGGPGPDYYIRCRIASGRFECPPQLTCVAFNTVGCEHALSVGAPSLGTSRGHASETYFLGAAPVIAGSVQLTLDDGVGDVQTDWREAPDFERAGAHDRVFASQPESGEIQCGDGLRGAVFPAGYQLSASFRVGGGPAGTVAAGSLSRIPASAANLALAPALGTLATRLAVWQRFAATGGTTRESVAATEARAFDRVTAVDKAVTLADVERLALATPGVPVSRVRAVANLEAALPCYPAPGVITLIVIPSCPRPAPLPSRALLDAIERYLEPRRLLTSELHAIAPEYARISVGATLHLTCDADSATVLAAARARLDAYFDPLVGGPDGTGWPFGRTVYRNEVMALLADNAGVAFVTGLTLLRGYAVSSGATASSCCGAAAGGGARCDNIVLCAHELTMPGQHTLITESDVPRTLQRSDAHECESAL